VIFVMFSQCFDSLLLQSIVTEVKLKIETKQISVSLSFSGTFT
jgi:hypothetical protein